MIPNPIAASIAREIGERRQRASRITPEMLEQLRAQNPELTARMVEGEREMLADIEAAITAGDLEKAIGLSGRNHGPVLLLRLWEAGRLNVQALRAVICDAWNGAEFPCLTVPRRIWLEWFRSVGFVSDSGRSAPTEPLEVWRSQVGRTIGLAWTTDRERAEWFHKRNVERPGCAPRMLHGFVPPPAVLAFVDERNEAEVVCDPTMGRFWKVVRR